MRAVTCTDSVLEVVEVPDPAPDRGQLLVDVVRAGICGSDLHARHHANTLADIASEIGYDALARSGDSLVMGHEFVAEVAHGGRGTRLKPGTPVVAFPLLRRDGAVHTIGLSPLAPGAYAEQLVVEESLAVPVPNGLPLEHAALTEPLAVGLHAVRRAEVGKGTVSVVVGCGPVGLAVISVLKARGVRTVIASDFSPGRRALATACGADIVVDPAEESPFDHTAGRGLLESGPEVFELAVGSMEKLQRVPVLSWHQVWRAAEAVGATNPKFPVVFECVGVPGVLDDVLTRAPLYSRVVVVGVCMEPDTIRPAMAINKEIDLRFVLGYTPREFRDSLHLLADGKVNAEPFLTGVVGLGGVDAAFTALADPESHAKILIDPHSDAMTPQPLG